MSEHENLNDEEAMKALSDFANACYAKGCRDTLIRVAVGAGLAITGYACTTLYQIIKSRKEAKELKKSINDFVKQGKES